MVPSMLEVTEARCFMRIDGVLGRPSSIIQIPDIYIFGCPTNLHFCIYVAHHPVVSRATGKRLTVFVFLGDFPHWYNAAGR